MIFPLGDGSDYSQGSLPTAGMLITTAGRIFVISAPSLGSKRRFQISPRDGVLALLERDVMVVFLR